MFTQTDLELDDGRVLHVYDTGDADGAATLTVVWHHGTPNIGAPPRPLFAASERLGIRWVAYDRPGYGGSTPVPGRDIASAAGDTARVADALGVGQFAVMGHSGGASHALACGALLPQRVLGVVGISPVAPVDAPGLDWFDGMAAAGQAALRAALRGREAKEAHEASAEFDPEVFTSLDHAALSGRWSWLMEVVGPALTAGPAPLIDDDLAYVAPWGCDPAAAVAPVLLLHGDQDRMVPIGHSRWFAEHCPTVELRTCPGQGHISVLDSGESALEWLCERVRSS